VRDFLPEQCELGKHVPPPGDELAVMPADDSERPKAVVFQFIDPSV
jgi:hypothetical protein